MENRFSEEACEELREWALARGNGTHRRTCPDCSTGRGKKTDTCLSATIDGEKVLATCWHCYAHGRINLEKREPRRVSSSWQKPYTPPKPEAPKGKPSALKEIGSGLDAQAILWFKQRGISEATANLYNVTWARAYFLQIKRETHAVAYPYFIDSKTVGHKARSTEDKDHVCKPALNSLFGLQNVDMNLHDTIIICEGEPDCLAMAEAGVPNPVSVPNGAASFQTRNEGADQRGQYGFLWSAKEQIDAAKRIFIATDMDEPGEKLADELARRIGRHRCWRVRFPEGCKDANDTLLKHGKKGLVECVQTAEPWPIDGLYEADTFFPEVMDLFKNGFGDRVGTGITPVDELYSIGKGLLTVITGIPGNGKSQFVDQLMVNTARRFGYVHAICSFENPVHVHIGKLAEVLVQKHFFKKEDRPGPMMSEEELNKTLPFIHQHFKFLHQEDGKKASIESIVERIKTAVFRWGVNCVVVDPYNYIHRPKTAESETQWIDDILTELRLVAQLHGIHIWFIAHPTKMQMDAEGRHQIPKGYQISGSAAWFSKPDFGLTVHRSEDQPGVVKIVCWKVRFDWLGAVGDCSILYDNIRHIYLADAFEDLMPLEDGGGPASYREAASL